MEVVKRKDLGGTVDGYCTGYGSDLWTVKRFCVPQQSVVSCGDRRSPGIVGDYDPCGYLYETAHLSVDPAGWCGGDRVSVSADLSDGTERLVLWTGIPVVLLVTAVVEAVTFCIRKLPMSFLTGALYLISGVAVLCVGLELLIDRFLGLVVH